MTKQDFKKLLSDRLVILDGATGTELMKRGMPGGVCPELWILEHPDVLEAVQDAYRAAGSMMVYVPSFGANRCKLAEYGLDGEVESINRRLAELAKRGDGGRLCLGDLSPTGQFLYPAGMLSLNEAVDIYREQIRGLVAGGVDGLVIETMMDLGEVRAALLAARLEAPELPVLVTMTFEVTGRTLTGVTPEAALVTVQELGADAFGCNCSTGPGDMVELLQRLRPFAKIPVGAKPNAGMPEMDGNGRTVFPLGPADFAAWATRFQESGAAFLGGCCGTTPEHIAALAASARALKPLGCASGRVEALASPREVLAVGAELLERPEEYLNTELCDISDSELAVETAQLAGVSDERAVLIRTATPAVLEAALAVYPGRALVDLSTLRGDDRQRGEKIASFFGALTCK